MTTPMERSVRRATGYNDVVRSHPKPRRKRRSPAKSLSTLDDLWRQVVRKNWGGRCALSEWGNQYYTHTCEGLLQCHHYIPRARMLTRFDPRNGVLLCQRAHDRAGMYMVRQAIETFMARRDPGVIDYLARQEQILFKDYLAQEGITRDLWRISQVARLKRLLGEEA